MRAIDKGKEPPSLTAHQETPHSSYDNYQDKGALRTALVKEQRGLCCYCMERIHDDRNQMKIEHWRCQAKYPDKQLIYRNLLGACLGRQGKPGKLQHCDTKKGDSELRWNPAEPSHQIEATITYRLDGTICSSDSCFDRQLNKEVLNLNLAWIRNDRKRIIDGILDWLEKQKPVSQDLLECKIASLVKSETLIPYVQVAVWWLQKKLARMES